MITTKKSINAGVKNFGAKAMSWNQVCKQLSGIGGYVTIDDKTKVRPLELMQSLGVHVLKNSYTPKDIFTAWSERMKKDGKVCIVGSVPYEVVVDGRTYVLHSKSEEKYPQVSQQVLTPLVSATDKSDKTDKVVNVNNILRGLQQSVFITATMDRIAKSAAKCAALKEGFINVSTDKKVEKYVKVAKANDGKWAIVLEEKKVATNAKKAAADTKKSSTKKSTRKAA